MCPATTKDDGTTLMGGDVEKDRDSIQAYLRVAATKGYRFDNAATISNRNHHHARVKISSSNAKTLKHSKLLLALQHHALLTVFRPRQDPGIVILLRLAALVPLLLEPFDPELDTHDMHLERHAVGADNFRHGNALAQVLEVIADVLQFHDGGRDVCPGEATIPADGSQQLDLVVQFGDAGAVAAELGPQVREQLLLVVLCFGVVARGDGRDDVQPTIEVVEDVEQGLGLGDERDDLVLDDAGVAQVLVQQDVAGQRDGLEGREDVEVGGDPGGEGAVAGLGGAHAVDDREGPEVGAEDVVDGAADAGVEFA